MSLLDKLPIDILIYITNEPDQIENLSQASDWFNQKYYQVGNSKYWSDLFYTVFDVSVETNSKFSYKEQYLKSYKLSKDNSLAKQLEGLTKIGQQKLYERIFHSIDERIRHKYSEILIKACIVNNDLEHFKEFFLKYHMTSGPFQLFNYIKKCCKYENIHVIEYLTSVSTNLIIKLDMKSIVKTNSYDFISKLSELIMKINQKCIYEWIYLYKHSNHPMIIELSHWTKNIALNKIELDDIYELIILAISYGDLIYVKENISIIYCYNRRCTEKEQELSFFAGKSGNYEMIKYFLETYNQWEYIAEGLIKCSDLNVDVIKQLIIQLNESDQKTLCLLVRAVVKHSDINFFEWLVSNHGASRLNILDKNDWRSIIRDVIMYDKIDIFKAILTMIDSQAYDILDKRNIKVFGYKETLITYILDLANKSLLQLNCRFETIKYILQMINNEVIIHNRQGKIVDTLEDIYFQYINEDNNNEIKRDDFKRKTLFIYEMLELYGLSGYKFMTGLINKACDQAIMSNNYDLIDFFLNKGAHDYDEYIKTSLYKDNLDLTLKFCRLRGEKLNEDFLEYIDYPDIAYWLYLNDFLDDELFLEYTTAENDKSKSWVIEKITERNTSKATDK